MRPPEAEAAQRIVESSKCKPVAATECADEEVNMEHATESFLARFVPAERFSGSRPGMSIAKILAKAACRVISAVAAVTMR